MKSKPSISQKYHNQPKKKFNLMSTDTDDDAADAKGITIALQEHSSL